MQVYFISKGLVMLNNEIKSDSGEEEEATTPTMIQGVNETYELTALKASEVPKDADVMNSRLVLIGKVFFCFK